MRLVSLCPSITETLFALGVGDQLVGVTRFCIHPAPEVRKVARVGGTKDPDLARIVDLAPDVVFMNAEENRREDHDALARTLRVDVSEPRRVDQVPALLRDLGVCVDRRAEAEALARTLEAELDALERAPRAAFRHAYLIWRDPWMAVSRDTYVADLIARAGGEVVTDDPTRRYPEVNLSDLARARPDVVFLPDEPFPFAEKHRPELEAALPGVRLSLVSGDDACWHGVRSIRGVRWAQTLSAELQSKRTP